MYEPNQTTPNTPQNYLERFAPTPTSFSLTAVIVYCCVQNDETRVFTIVFCSIKTK